MTTPWPFPFSLSGRFEQPIAPVTTWFPTVVNYMGNMAIEKRVIEEVGSFGRQIGMITDALIELGQNREGGPEMERLVEMHRRIGDIKREESRSLADQARQSFASLTRLEPREAERVLDDLRDLIRRAKSDSAP